MPSPRQIKRNHCTTTNLLRDWGTGALVRPKWKGHGRDANIENHENPSVDMETRERGGWKEIVRQFQQFPTMVLKTTWTTGNNFFKVPDGQPRPAQKEQKGLLGSERKVNSENHENHFADIETREGCGWAVGARASSSQMGFLFCKIDAHTEII